MYKVVVADNEYPNLNPEREAFEELGLHIDLVDGQCTNEDELIAAAGDADAIINLYNWITPRVIENLQKCKVIATYGIGVDKINIDAATKRGIYVCNNLRYNEYEVCDHTVAMILALNRQLVQSDRAVRRGVWGGLKLENRLFRPYGQTIGFVGFGRIAKQIIEKMKVFGMNAICFDPYLSAEQCEAAGAKKVELDEVMSQSDYVSINAPLNDATRHIVGERELRLMKPTAYLVNCGRGAVVDEKAMIKVLQEKAIAGAALDTCETEPVPVGHPLLDLDNVFITPHSAWYTWESMYLLQHYAARQAALVLAGQKPEYCVNYDAVQEVLKNK